MSLPYFNYNEKEGTIYDYAPEYKPVIFVPADFNCCGDLRLLSSQIDFSRILKAAFPRFSWQGTGACLETESFYALVVRKEFYEPDNISAIKVALLYLRERIQKDGVDKIVIQLPHLVGVKWQEVHDGIFEVFGGDALKMVVTYIKTDRVLVLADADMEKINYEKNKDLLLNKKYF